MQETIEYIRQAFELKSQQCYKQAIEMLYKALELENDNLEILFQLGELYYLLKNFPRAVGYLEKVTARNSNHIESLNILKQIHIFQNEYKEAYKMAERVFNIQKTPENLSELIKIAAKLGNIDKIKEFEKSEIADGNVIYNCAKAYYDNACLDDAKITE
ncbi:MAG: tetratricopeptide repeat protein [Candidatus Gastranaerophilaceae bacterium]